MTKQINYKKWGLTATSLVFSYLFYDQGIGINLAIFNLIIIVISLLNRRQKWNSKFGLFVLASLLTSTSVVFINSTLSITANFISLIALVGFAYQKELSLITTLLNAWYSLIASSFVALGRYWDKLTSDSSPIENTQSSRLKLLKFSSYVLPVLGVVVFLLLYSSANPAFANVFQSIKIDFISFAWIRFTLVSAFFLTGIFHFAQLNRLNKWDMSLPLNIVRTRNGGKELSHPLALKYEFKTAILLLLLLNIALGFFNVFDLFQHLTVNYLPVASSYSAAVHNGVNTLIASIVLAISVILFFFRGNLNFFSKSKPLIILAHLWVLQNVILVAGIVYNNSTYIMQYGLTYKRIGVFVYLILALAGLLTTFYKIQKRTNHWHMIRVNSWVAMSVLILFSFFNWDNMIVRFNLYIAQTQDIEYLLKLSERALPVLVKYDNLEPHRASTIESRTQDFIENQSNKSWQSWTYQDQLISKTINL